MSSRHPTNLKLVNCIYALCVHYIARVTIFAIRKKENNNTSICRGEYARAAEDTAILLRTTFLLCLYRYICIINYHTSLQNFTDPQIYTHTLTHKYRTHTCTFMSLQFQLNPAVAETRFENCYGKYTRMHRNEDFSFLPTVKRMENDS